MPPKRQSDAQLLWQAIRQIEENMQQMVNHVNKWVAKIQGIDSVAFAALMLHDGKEFTLDTEKVAKNQEQIKAVLAEMGRYREEMQKKAEAESQESLAKSIGSLPEGKAKEPKQEKKDVSDGTTDTAKG